jgi:hypothetical protein
MRCQIRRVERRGVLTAGVMVGEPYQKEAAECGGRPLGANRAAQ